MGLTYGTARGIQTAIRLFFPPQCLTCDELTEAEGTLCGSCWRDTPFLAGALCEVCAVPLPGDLAEGEVAECDACLAQPKDWARGRAALQYDGNTRRLAMALKHGDRLDIARPAAAWMARAGADLFSKDSLIVPVPLHRFRLFTRTFNQAALLAREVAKCADTPLALEGLIRKRPTKALGRLSPAERHTLLEDAIVANPSVPLADKSVVLVDDVMTSGATLNACARALIAAGTQSVDVLVLARAVRGT